MAMQTAKRTLIVGLGKTGVSCARFLAGRGEQVAVADSRIAPPGLDVLRDELPDVPVFVGGFSEEAFNAADRLLVSPGVSLQEPVIASAVSRGVEVVGDIELFCRYAQAPIVAITGSNGKSTVTTLVGEMARADGKRVLLGGNLGTPALELLNEPVPELYVLELSSFQLETVRSLNAVAAVVLNISPDHMDRYESLAHYAAAKQVIYHGNGLIVLNADDPVVMAMHQPGRRSVLFRMSEPKEGEFGLRTRNGEEWLAYGSEYLLAKSQMNLVGRHNLANALAALALGQGAGLSMAGMLSALRSFRGLPHRCQLVAEHAGVRWVNDSKGTNVGATEAAVEGVSGQVILIAGGEGKDQDFAPLRRPMAAKGRAIVLIGRDAGIIERALEGVVQAVRASSMQDAVKIAASLAQPGDTVLLSPACASFDMFANYEARGLAFCHAVEEIIP